MRVEMSAHQGKSWRAVRPKRTSESDPKQAARPHSESSVQSPPGTQSAGLARAASQSRYAEFQMVLAAFRSRLLSGHFCSRSLLGIDGSGRSLAPLATCRPVRGHSVRDPTSRGKLSLLAALAFPDGSRPSGFLLGVHAQDEARLVIAWVASFLLRSQPSPGRTRSMHAGGP
jgi:hypothetical protein